MNLGVYVSSLGDTELLRDIGEGINFGIESKILTDASIFYDNVAYNPFVIKCGIFNSTDLWNFRGKLIIPSLSTVASSLKIVNDIEAYYYYGFEQNTNVLHLLHLLGNNLIPVSTSEESSNDLYRKTGIKSRFIAPTFKDFIINLG